MKSIEMARREGSMRKRSGRFASVAVCALALSLLGCAAGPPGSDPRINPFDRAVEGTEDVLLTVQNNDFRDASIYAIWNGVKRRVGEVTGMTSETFRMTWMSEEIQLAIDFVGGGGYTSERVPVTQGDHLDFVIMGGR
jgi:hypothetical protein